MLGSTTLLTTYATSSERYVFAKPYPFVFSCVLYPIVNFVVFKASKKPLGVPNLLVTEHSYYLGVSFRFIFDPTNILIKRISSYQSVPQDQKSVIFFAQSYRSHPVTATFQTCC